MLFVRPPICYNQNIIIVCGIIKKIKYLNMNKRKSIIFIFLISIGVVAGAYQYIQMFQTDIVSAIYSIPNPGHSWAEMECSSDLCVTGGRVGIGTDSPGNKLSVTGNISSTGTITATTDVCIAGGPCLSSLSDSALVNGIHSVANCTAAGGTAVPSGQIGSQCRFNAAACPTGWTRFGLWSTTQNVAVSHAQTSCTQVNTGACSGGTGTGTSSGVVSAIADLVVNSGSHPWGNLATETATGTWTGGVGTTAVPCVVVRSGCQTATATVYMSGGAEGYMTWNENNCITCGGTGCCYVEPNNGGSDHWCGWYKGYVWGTACSSTSGTVSSTATISQIGCY